MALLFCAGFDFLPDGINTSRFGQMGYYNLPDGPYPPQIRVASPGRFGYGKYCYFDTNPNGYGHVTHFFPDGVGRDEAYMGMAITGSDACYDTMQPYLEFSFGATSRLRMVLRDLGIVEIYQNSVLIFTSPSAQYYTNSWNYWEFGAKLADDTTGWLTVRLNTVPIISIVDQATAGAGLTTIDGFGFGHNSDAPAGGLGSNYAHFDDLYVTDETGSTNVGFLGNVRVQTLLPDGDSGVQEFDVEPVINANWESASNVAIDDTEYVYSGVTNAQDKYTLSALDNAPLVLGVQVSGAYRQDDATQRSVATVIDSNGTESEGTEYFTPQSNFTFKVDIWETDPDTTVAWLYTAVNGLIVGPKVKS